MKCVREEDPLVRHLALMLLAMAAFGGLVLARWGSGIEGTFSCGLRRLVGIPCPLCGGLRASLALVRLDLPEAWAANPLVTLAALVLLVAGAYAILATLVPGLRRQIQLPAPVRSRFSIGLMVLVVAAWVHQILQ